MKNQLNKKVVLFALISSFSVSLYSQEITSENNTETQATNVVSNLSVTKPKPTLLPNTSLEVGTELSSNVVRYSDEERSLNTLVYFSTSTKLRNDSYITSALSASKDINSPQKMGLSNLRLRYSHKDKDFGQFSLRHRLSLHLPTSEMDREDASFRGAISYDPRIKYEFITIPLDTHLIFLARRNLHRFSTNSDGNQNIENSLTTRLELIYKFADRYMLLVAGQHNWGVAYNSSNRYRFGLEQEIAMRLSPASTIALGHRNSGSVVRADGSSNMNLYDKTSSQVYTYITYSL